MTLRQLLTEKPSSPRAGTTVSALYGSLANLLQFVAA
jgi:hypothetical protein